MNNLPRVVIVGRMNVGKSTLFNRLSSKVKSITLDYAGVTRDILHDTVEWQGRTFDLIDTGGIVWGKQKDPLLEQVRERALAELEPASVVLLVVDGTSGPLSEDAEIARLIRKRARNVILVVNKSDVKSATDHETEWYGLPHDRRVLISAQHGRGIADLLEAIVEFIPEKVVPVVQETPALRVVFLGRPNVGKSSLMNLLLQEERSIVSNIPGTTREAISEKVSFYQEQIQLTDTPGIRRQRAIDETVETLMVKSSFKALKDGQVVLLLIDASEATMVDQELKLAFYAFSDLYKALIILVNKSDLATEESRESLQRCFDEYPGLINKIELLNISCKTGKNVGRVLPLVKEVGRRHSQRLDAARIKHLFQEALQKSPLVRNEQPIKVFSVEQIAITPITLLVRVNNKQFIESSQRNFFENIIRKNFDVVGVPIKFVFD